jgi:hypothetical protein
LKPWKNGGKVFHSPNICSGGNIWQNDRKMTEELMLFPDFGEGEICGFVLWGKIGERVGLEAEWSARELSSTSAVSESFLSCFYLSLLVLHR